MTFDPFKRISDKIEEGVSDIREGIDTEIKKVSDRINQSPFGRIKNFLQDIFKSSEGLGNFGNTFTTPGASSSSVLTYINHTLFTTFQPDINGYTFIFMIPPDLSGWRVNKEYSSLYDQFKSSFSSDTGRFLTFAAVDFTPPQKQVNTERISSRSGGVPYATEVINTEQCSVTFIDSVDLEVYTFHHMWIKYIRHILDGRIAPAPEYYIPVDSDQELSSFGAIDYAASIYVVKYRPDVQTITWAAKCIGIIPQSLPAKELIGTRTSNELTTLPFTYFISEYREAVWMEKIDKEYHWIFKELDDHITSNFG